MHFLALIPVAALLLSVAFAAVAFAWNSERRATGAMIRVFLCIAAWALIDLLSQLETDPAQAVFWLGWMHLPVLLLGTAVLQLVSGGRAASSLAVRTFVRLGYGFSLVFALASPFLPGIVDGVRRNGWGGWTPDYGLVSIIVVALGCILPAIAVASVLRNRPDENSPRPRGASYAVGGAILFSVLTSLTTDILLPFAGLAFPRLGSLTAVIAAAGVWLQLLHRSDDLTLTPQGIARAVLADLHEGVAFVNRSGTVLSVNERLVELAGVRSATLVGGPLSDLVEVPIDLVRAGLHDREFRMRFANGETAPVSLSSSLVREADGGVGWVIVVFRDLRGVDALRRRLLTSGRLAAIGELAAGIAHEVNNPAAFIRSDLNFLRGRLAEIHADLEKQVEGASAEVFERGFERIDRAIEGVERIVEVVGDVRGFAHLGAAEGAECLPDVIVEGAVRLARLERREEVALHVVRNPDLPRVTAGQDLKQVMLAMIRLMTISSRVGGSVEIALAEVDGRLSVSLRADDLVQRAESQIHRFEMAREDVLEASAADLGLAIAIELIDQLGGALQVEAQSEFALSIDLMWPIAEEDAR